MKYTGVESVFRKNPAKIRIGIKMGITMPRAASTLGASTEMNVAYEQAI